MSKKKYAPRIPRAANGFRVQDLRPPPRGAWWVKGWLQAIEAMRLGARAGRGKVYAERGQVTELAMSGTHVEAAVQGGRPERYTVKIDFRPLSRTASDFGAMTIGRVLAGEMPSVVGEAFAVAQRSPYPALGVDRFWCSCPDWSKPCKHIAAVLYLLGDALVRDPGLLLRLRGIDLPGDDGAETRPLPLWKGTSRFREALSKTYRRTGFA